MIRETSIEAYNYLKDSGLLSKRRWEVWSMLAARGPLSQRETSFYLRDKLDWGINPRFSELKSMGMIIEVGQKIDEQTNQTVYIWDVTNRKHPLKWNKSMKLTPQKKINMLESTIKELQEELLKYRSKHGWIL